MLSILFILSETVATVSLSAPATVTHIRRWAVNTVPAVGQTMQLSDNYLDGHLPPEILQTDGRDSFNSVSDRPLAVSFEVPACDSPHRADSHGGLRQRCADGRRAHLRTHIRKNSWDPWTDADGSPPKIRGRGLTLIINLSSALGKLTHWAQWADAIV